MNHPNRTYVAIIASCGVFAAYASGGTGEYKLPWTGRGEVLAYRSCGCADSCWVAEVRNIKSGAVKAKLRCDCEKLHFRVQTRGPEQLYAESCSVINEATDKPKAIREEMDRLLSRR